MLTFLSLIKQTKFLLWRTIITIISLFDHIVYSTAAEWTYGVGFVEISSIFPIQDDFACGMIPFDKVDNSGSFMLHQTSQIMLFQVQFFDFDRIWNCPWCVCAFDITNHLLCWALAGGATDGLRHVHYICVSHSHYRFVRMLSSTQSIQRSPLCYQFDGHQQYCILDHPTGFDSIMQTVYQLQIWTSYTMPAKYFYGWRRSFM